MLTQSTGCHAEGTRVGMRSFLTLLLVFALVMPPASASVFGGAGATEFKNGQKAEAKGDFDSAVAWYQKAFDKDRKNMNYETALRRTRFTAGMKHVDAGHKLRDLGKLDEALVEFQKARMMDSSTAISEQEINRTLAMIEARKISNNAADALTPQQREKSEYEKRMMRAEGPAELMPVSRAPINVRMTNESKVVFETIGKIAGINVLTDPDYQGRRITVELINSTLEEALDYACIQSKTKWSPISSNTIVIYNDSRARDREPLVMKTFYLTNTVKDTEITEITQVLRNMLENVKLMQVNSQNAIVIRCTPDQMAVAEKIIADIDKAKAEVVIDVTVLAVERDLSKTLGITPVSNGAPGLSLPATFSGGVASAAAVAAAATGTTSTTPTTTTTTTGTTTPTGNVIPLNGLIHTSINQFSTTLPGASLAAVLSDAHTKILQNPQVRASDGQVAKLRVGERVPIATGTFSTGIVATGGLPAAQTSFQYTDVGVIMEITPRVNGLHEVSLKLVIEISAVNSYVTIGGVSQPVIGQRRVEQDIRLREGEMNVLGGIIQDQTSITKAGVPLLGSLPLIGHFFSQDQTTISTSEVLIVLTPHIVRSSDISELNLRGIDTGTATSTQVRFRGAPAPAAMPGTTPGAVPPGTAPATGTLPAAGTTPPAAAPQSVPATPAPPPANPAGAPATGVPDQSASGGMQLRFGESNVNATMGKNISMNLELAGAQDVNAVPFQVRFDPKVLRLINVVLGDFLTKDGQTANSVPTIDNANGTGLVAVTRPQAAPGISGSGRLVTMTFQPVGPGSSTVKIFGATARGPGHEPKSLAEVQATVTVAPEPVVGAPAK
jgi:general secretion pathway protein D